MRNHLTFVLTSPSTWTPLIFIFTSPFVWTPLLALIGIIYSLAVKSKLPDPIPLHWDSNGLPDRFIARGVALVLLPLIGLLLSGLVQVATWLDKSNREHSRHSKVAIGCASLLPIAMTLQLHINLLQTASQPDARLTAEELFTLCGRLLVFSAFLLRELEPNFIVGICNKWTLQSRRVWDATHKFASWLFFATGVLCLMFSWINPSGIWEAVTLALYLLIPALASTAYSYSIRDRPVYSAEHWDLVTAVEPLIPN